MAINFFRSTALVASLAASLGAVAPAMAGPIATAGPLGVGASEKTAAPVETVAYRHHYHHYRHHYYNPAGAAVAGAALGIIGMAMANSFYNDYDGCYYGGCGYYYGGPVYTYGGPVYGGWGGGWHGYHHFHHFGGWRGGHYHHH